MSTRGNAVAPRPVRHALKTVTRASGQMTARFRVLPDFLVIGTKRGGTTSLFNALRRHPDVAPMFPRVEDIKSPHYFEDEWERGETWYRSFFPTRGHLDRSARRTGFRPVTGESSSYYLFHPLASTRAAHTVPDAKVIVVLRDPVARAYSHYWERVRRGVEPLSFADAIEAEPRRLDGERERLILDPSYVSSAYDSYSYLARGRYAEQLRPWMEWYPKSQLLVMGSEDLYREPETALTAVQEFLELRVRDLAYPHRQTGDQPKPIDPPLREELRDYFQPHNKELYDLVDRDFEW